VYVLRLVAGLKSQADLGRVPRPFQSAGNRELPQGLCRTRCAALGGRLRQWPARNVLRQHRDRRSQLDTGLPEEFKRRCGYDLMPYLPLVPASMPIQTSGLGQRPLDEIVTRVRYDYCRVLVDLFLDSLGAVLPRCHENGTLCRWQAYGWPLFYGIEGWLPHPRYAGGNNWLFPRRSSIMTRRARLARVAEIHLVRCHQAGRRIA